MSVSRKDTASEANGVNGDKASLDRRWEQFQEEESWKAFMEDIQRSMEHEQRKPPLLKFFETLRAKVKQAQRLGRKPYYLQLYLEPPEGEFDMVPIGNLVPLPKGWRDGSAFKDDEFVDD